MNASALALMWLLADIATADALQTPPEKQPSSHSEESELDVITVEAHRRKLIEEQISQFVSAITLPDRRESLGRWKLPICPLVAGLPRDRGEFILARLSEVARESAAPLAPEACKPNFLIVVTTEPERLLEKWWARNPRLFNTLHGQFPAEHFVHTDRPIRIWYNANAGCGDGGLSFAEIGGMTYPSCRNFGLDSRLTWEETRDIESIIMVIDWGRIKDLSIGQVADYVAMTGLAEIREDAEPGAAPTILHLFGDTGTARPMGLSGWDRAFLKALYTTKQASVMQLEEIKLRLDEQLVPKK